MPNIKLKSSDNKIFTVDEEVARVSVMIRTMLDDLGTNQDDEEEIIPLPAVRGEILEKVITWATHHKADAASSPYDYIGEGTNYDISEWDAEFLRMDKHELFELTRAANFLDVRGLLNMTCATVANMVKGKTPREIRQVFNIP